MQEGQSRYRPFPETRWSLVVRAGESGTAEQSRALADLCAFYWPPVYAYIRSKGHPSHDAEDLTQGFFADFLERESFSRTDPARGKLRAYVLSSVKHYLSSERRDAGRIKRGGGAIHFSIDMAKGEARRAFVEPSDDLSPDRLFDRQWATTLLEVVIGTVESVYRETGKQTLFTELRRYIQADADSSDSAASAIRLGMTENAMRVAVHRLRQRYARALREAVADTIAEGEDPEVELRHLMTSFR